MCIKGARGLHSFLWCVSCLCCSPHPLLLESRHAGGLRRRCVRQQPPEYSCVAGNDAARRLSSTHTVLVCVQVWNMGRVGTHLRTLYRQYRRALGTGQPHLEVQPSPKSCGTGGANAATTRIPSISVGAPMDVSAVLHFQNSEPTRGRGRGEAPSTGPLPLPPCPPSPPSPSCRPADAARTAAPWALSSSPQEGSPSSWQGGSRWGDGRRPGISVLLCPLQFRSVSAQSAQRLRRTCVPTKVPVMPLQSGQEGASHLRDLGCSTGKPQGRG